MSTPPDLVALLEQINSGRAAQALPELDALVSQLPQNPTVQMLRAEALRHLGRNSEAIPAYIKAGECGGEARNWLAAGLLLTAERATEQALECLHKALAADPDSEDVLDALIPPLFNSGRHKEGIQFARRQIQLSANPRRLARAALLLHASDLYEESAEAFKRIIALDPHNPAHFGSALLPARFTCEWEWIETLQEHIGSCYAREDFAGPQEFPLTHLTWCADEAINLGVTRAYCERMVPRKEPLSPAPLPAAGRRIRVGYLSSDFRNHATMHLIAGMLEQHDRDRVEIFAYDYTAHEISEYRQRFLDAVEHHVPIQSMTDAQAAQRIAEDRLDILFDLKVHVGDNRPGIMAQRPSRLQAAFIGFPGSAASAEIDYAVTDRFVTPDSSAPFYTEKLCRLPHSYQCNDRQRPVAADPGSRSRHGLPEEKVVFGVFNQSYKIDRGSFAVWMRILHAVPDSVLWLLDQGAAARTNLLRHATLAGIEASRIVFADFVEPQEHLARLQLADAVLDALVCNGHTTTSDSLWAGVPVITARGRHFASRVSESLLNAIGLPELVGQDADEMVSIARRIGTDAQFRAALRAKVAANRLTTPLFDTARFTRDFENAIELMVTRQRQGLAPELIDVPDAGPLDPKLPRSTHADRAAALWSVYKVCPLCEGASTALGFSQATRHPLWHESLPQAIQWMRCKRCGHTHTRHHWTGLGRQQLLRNAQANPVSVSVIVAQRALWSSVPGRVTALLGGHDALFNQGNRRVWVDVGCGDGALLSQVLDHGYAAVGVDLNPQAVERIQKLGFSAVQHDFMTLDVQITPDVISLLDVLPQLPDPRAALHKAAQVLRPGGVLVVSAPDSASALWPLREAEQANPDWEDIERHHIFNRDLLLKLLQDCGFTVTGLVPSERQPTHVEIYALRTSAPPSRLEPSAQAYEIIQVRPAGYIHAEALTEIAECVHHGLRRLGAQSFYGTPVPGPARQIILGAHMLDAAALSALPADAILYTSEQIDTDSRLLTGPYLAALRSREVWDYSSENVRKLKALGAASVQHVPLGYVPELTRIPHLGDEIDVLFYGSVNPRRQHILHQLQLRGLNVVVLFGKYGEERDAAIARAKVVLMVHYYEAKIFEVVRAAYLLSNSKAVVAEINPDTSVEPDLCDAVRGVPYDNLVDACVELVNDPARRQNLGQRALQVFSARREEDILATALKRPTG